MIGLCVPMHQKKGPLGNKVNRSKRFTVPRIVTTIDQAGAAVEHAAVGIAVVTSSVPWGWQWHAREQCVCRDMGATTLTDLKCIPR